MRIKILGLLALTCALGAPGAYAQKRVVNFVDGNVLTAAQLNAMQLGFVNTTNGTATGLTLTNGTATGTDVSAAIANGVTLSSGLAICPTSSPNTYYGAVNSSSEMGIASNTVHLLASGNAMPYFNISGIAGTIYGAGGNINDISGPIGMSGFQNILKTTGVNGMVELAYTQYMTPDVPSKYWQNVENSDGSASIDDSAMLTQTGFKPDVALLNIRRDVDVGVVANDDDTYLTANDEQNILTAISDIEKNVPTAKGVWPFILPNQPGHDFVTDDYWATTRDVLQKAGGVGIDVPAGLYTINRSSSIAPIAEEIKWANSLGIKTVVLLSPYAEDTPAGYGSKVYPQWRYDSQFLTHVRNIVSWLQAAGASPTAWSVVSYSPIQWYDPTTGGISGTKCTGCTQVTANLMGSDTDSVNQTVAYVARWVAENAPTSTYTSMPNMGQVSHPCASTVLSGYASQKPVIGVNQVGLGSLAYTDYDAADLKYPTLEGAEITDNLNILGSRTIGFGVGSTTSIPYLGFDSVNGGLSVSGAPFNIVGGFNLNLFGDSSIALSGGNQSFEGTGTNGIQFQSKDGTKSSWVTGDGSGGINIGTSVQIDYTGNVNYSKSAFFTSATNIAFTGSGENGIQFQSKDGSLSSWEIGDTTGGIQLGNGLYSRYNGTLELKNYSKSAILAITSPAEGQIVNDSTDHVPVIYENGSWYPITLGTALSQ